MTRRITLQRVHFPFPIPSLFLLTALLLAPVGVAPALAQKGGDGKAADKAEKEEEGPLSTGTFAGLAFREIGPAIASGRISDLAIDPSQPAVWYAAVASGGVWKTPNAGTTWIPLFDQQGSYSIGDVTLDPNNPLTVWVGTGENNSQRSVGYGDGVYKSIDGGKSWNKVGLEDSQHIGKIEVDPRDSKVVWVAAQGPLWSAGGDRGLYKTTDGGATWKKMLEISEHTGVSDVHLDPRDPDVVYATAYQRRRRVWTLINGGPESAIYKSTDGGESWKKLENGLPKEVDLGRIGLAVSPVNPDVVYAIVEAAADEGGFFRSTDAGANWEKRSDYVSGSPQYYQEIYADLEDVDRVYSMDTFLQVTEDGGATWNRVPNNARHVDDHALWIDPADTAHLVVGCDGGIYESWDRGDTWRFIANLPVTQFYKLALDDDEPFYNVYGGTQDNFTLGGPSRTKTAHGITNRDWTIVLGGDGFQPQVEPGNPDIVYAQWQYGNLARYDRKTGETIDIQPQESLGEEPYKFNWDSPLIISPHSPTRLYYAAQRVFRSDDRGDTWEIVSPDLTRQLDRNELEVMGRVWSVDAVSKNRSTSFYGNIVALAESPLVEGLLYAGTDDGLIQVSEDGGESWRRVESFPGVPERTYVNDLVASLHDPDTVFAAFNNHKSGDFKPYLLKSTDRGRTWTSITGDLPERGSTYAVAQDHVQPDLLFAGTEFGAFFSLDGGGEWIELSGLPTVAVRDLAVQRRENDLVAATFGRGFWVLDDYTPLRGLTEEELEQKTLLFPVKDAWMYMESTPLGLPGKAFQGDGYYTASNPPFGAVFTYYLKEEIQTREKKRREMEAEMREKGEAFGYPSWEELRAEDREEEPTVLLTVRDDEGNVIRRLTGPVGKGMHRVAWDLRWPPSTPTSLEPQRTGFFGDPPRGPMAVPGIYTVELAQRVESEITELAGPVSFEAKPLGQGTLPPADREAQLAFQKKVARLQRAALGATRAVGEAHGRIDHLKQALLDTPEASREMLEDLRSIELRLLDLEIELTGDPTISSRSEPTPPAVVGRVNRVVGGTWTSTSAPTNTQQANYRAAADAFAEVLPQLQTLIDEYLAGLEAEAEALGAPWTPGRVPTWSSE